MDHARHLWDLRRPWCVRGTLDACLPAPAAPAEPRRWCRAGQTAITDATIWTAVEECQAESATFDCPASQATYGPIEDWDVGAVTSLNTFGNGCTHDAWMCGRASAIRLFDVA